jgi:hypothetical protein
MGTEKQITITRVELAAALQHWEAEAKAEGWSDRTDGERFGDNADYLISVIEAARA